VADIKPLRRGQALPEPPKENAELLEFLRELTEKAEKGEIEGVLVVVLHENHAEYEQVGVDDGFQAIGHLEYLKKLLMEGDDEYEGD
jgi:hypothetical protein